MPLCRWLPSSVRAAVHGAAESGVPKLTQHLAVSGGPRNIRAVCISTGLMRTPATQQLIESPAAVALFITSDEASFINGGNIVAGSRGSITKP